jgi:hypothetical protein
MADSRHEIQERFWGGEFAEHGRNQIIVLVQAVSHFV